MSLLNLKQVTVAFGDPPLIEAVDLALETHERVCLVGRNGEGKTTLLRVLDGGLAADDGEVQRDPGLRIGTLPQALPGDLAGTVHEVIASGLGELGALVVRTGTLGPDDRAALDAVHARINALEGWDAERHIARAADTVGLSLGTPVAVLSGGQLRRLLIARALVCNPDLLILDEPTNHLDLPGIEWLESLLLEFPGTVVFTTHDRMFLSRVATRIVELDRGALTSWPGDYANYLRRRDERLAAERTAQAQFRRRLNEEERWIRQGIMARRTRNEGRVRRLHAMRAERLRRRTPAGNARFTVSEAESSGRQVIEAQAVDFAYGEQVIARGLSTIIQRGDKVGIIGPNGSGKTTLIRLLLGDLEPQQGRIIRGTRLETAYFDQRREQLDDDASVLDSVADGADTITVDGESRHVISYLQSFLFPPDRARGPVRALSGGERNRLLLARLFARPSNLMVLDEPTNDLDVETLELLEEQLEQYRGTLIVVSHDRAFLDNVITSALVLEGAGRIVEHVGGYSQWHQAADRPSSLAPPRPEPAASAKRPARGRRTKPLQRKLSNNDRRELGRLPERIEALEAHIATLNSELADPALYRREGAAVAERAAALAAAQAELESSYERWSALEALERD